MARPPYETEGNRTEERQIAETVRWAWSCEVAKLPRAYNLDYALLRSRELVAWSEIKRRYRMLGEHDTVFLSMQKVFAAHLFHIVTGKPCFFIVQFNDYLAYADMLVPGRRIEFRGRTDRGDWEDQEPVALIPTEEFKVIKVQEAAE